MHPIELLPKVFSREDTLESFKGCSIILQLQPYDRQRKRDVLQYLPITSKKIYPHV